MTNSRALCPAGIEVTNSRALYPAGIDSDDTIESFFDPVVYEKGASLLRMLRAYLNRDASPPLRLRRRALAATAPRTASGAAGQGAAAGRLAYGGAGSAALSSAVKSFGGSSGGGRRLQSGSVATAYRQQPALTPGMAANALGHAGHEAAAAAARGLLWASAAAGGANSSDSSTSSSSGGGDGGGGSSSMASDSGSSSGSSAGVTVSSSTGRSSGSGAAGVAVSSGGSGGSISSGEIGGADPFIAGLRAYLKAHKFGSATNADMWSALADASGAVSSSAHLEQTLHLQSVWP